MSFKFRELPIAIALLAICAFFAMKEPAFLGARNLSMLATELSITATLAMGMLLILLPGHIDLSAGSGVGLLGGIASVLVFHHELPAPAALGLGLLCGVLIWMAMGAFIVCERMPSFIVTLATLLAFRGIAKEQLKRNQYGASLGGPFQRPLVCSFAPRFSGIGSRRRGLLGKTKDRRVRCGGVRGWRRNRHTRGRRRSRFPWRGRPPASP